MLPFQLALRRLEARRKSCSVCQREDSCVTVCSSGFRRIKDGSIRRPKDDYRKERSYRGAILGAGENGAAELHVVYTQLTTVEA